MKIETLHLVNSLSPQGINSKDNDFEMNELGVLITPKGGIRSFSRRVRFVPWANIKACDIAEERPPEPVITHPAPAVTAEQFEAGLRDPERNKQPDAPPADVVKFEKNERGQIVERLMPHRAAEPSPRMQDLDIAKAHPMAPPEDAAKSAFAKLKEAKAEPAPE